MSTVGNILFECALTAFDSIFAVYFISKFLYTTVQNKWSIPTMLLLFASQSFFDFFMPIEIPFMITTLIQLAIVMTYALLICNKQYFRAIWGAIMHKLILIGITNLMLTVLSCFYDFDTIVTIGIGGARIVICTTQKLILFSVYTLILHFCDRESKGKPLYFWLLFLFAAGSIAADQLIVNVIIAAENAELQIALIVVSSLILLLNLVLYVMLGMISKLERERYQLALFAEQGHFEQSKYQEALGLYRDAEKMRHDVKHHIGVLSAMLENGNSAECRDYIEKYFSVVGQKPKFSPSGNIVVDYLLKSKFAPLNDTQIIVTGTTASLVDIPAPELASILGNVLDNAIEAEESLAVKRIELFFGMQGENRVIVCKNAIEGSVLSENKELQSTKKGGHLGMGHRIVEDLVEKHHGNVSYSEEDGMFCVTLIIPMNIE